MHLVGTLFDAQPAIGIVDWLLVFLEAFGDIGAEVVFFDVGIEVLDIVGHHFAQAGDLLL